MITRYIPFAIVLIIALAAYACGGGGGDNAPLPGGAEHTQQVTVEPNGDATITLESGARAHFPSGCFEVPTIIVFSDTIVGPEREADTYPAGTPGLVSYLTINNPATEDNQFQRDITVTFNIRVEDLTDGMEYWVYRYDDLEGKWIRFASAIATVTSEGTLATATLPTTGIAYYVGSIGLFDGLLADGGTLPGDAAGIVTGIITDAVTEEPVEGVDVMLYLVDGGETLAHDFLNGEADPDNPNNHNLTYTDADGRYELRFAESDIGAGMVYVLRLAQICGEYAETETGTFTVSEGVNPDKDFVVTPAE